MLAICPELERDFPLPLLIKSDVFKNRKAWLWGKPQPVAQGSRGSPGAPSPPFLPQRLQLTAGTAAGAISGAVGTEGCPEPCQAQAGQADFYFYKLFSSLQPSEAKGCGAGASAGDAGLVWRTLHSPGGAPLALNPRVCVMFFPPGSDKSRSLISPALLWEMSYLAAWPPGPASRWPGWTPPGSCER